jgi:hypothetical protein
MAIVGNASDVSTASISAALFRSAVSGDTATQAGEEYPLPEGLEGNDDDRGLVLTIASRGDGTGTLKLWGAELPLRGDADGGARTSMGLRFSLDPDSADTLVGSDVGDPFGRFRRTRPWRPDRIGPYLGEYRSEELPTTWQLDEAEPGSLRVSVWPDAAFEPVASDTFVAEYTTLRFARRGDGVLALTMDAPRTNGFDFVRL